MTLTGPGGVGKTRLAIEAATELEAVFEDGAVFVSLAAIRDPELVVPAIAHSLGLRELADRPPPEQLAAALRTRHLMLVLDNFEQVVDAGPQVTALLRACPRLKVLVTSRAVLHVTGEQDFPVPSLPLPEDERRAIEELARNDAVALFVARAHAANPSFALTTENAAMVAAICARLDGLPLAIELAAPWLRLLSPPALLERLRAQGHRSLQLLTGGARDQPDRQRTLRDAIAWSYDLLAPEEQALFRRLAVFPGGFTLDAAEAIGAEVGGWKAEGEPVSVLDGIASLADKSLVQQVARPDGVPRFRMLETIREFGLEQLAITSETDETMLRLAGWGRRLMDGAEQGFYSTMQWLWVERFETELDNLRAVLAWALERDDAATAQVLVANLGWLWVPRGFLSEGRAWGERALALGDRSPTPQRALSLAMTGTLSYYQGDLSRARSLALEGLDQSRATGQAAGEGISTIVLAWVASSEGSFDEAEAYATGTLTHYRTAGNATWAGFALNTLGTIAYQRGDLDRAAIRFEEAHHAIRAVGNTYGIGFVLSNLAKVARDQGEYGRSAALYAESLALRYQQGEKPSMAGGLRGLASIAAATKQYVRAARLWGAAEALNETIGAPSPQPRARALQAIEQTRAALGDETFAAAWAAGRALTLAEAMSEALEPSSGTVGQGALDVSATLSARYGLTPREVEVLRLIATGRSNPEIADALCITTRTAQTHVQHILDKLDVNSRTEAATLAVKHGLPR